MPVTCIAGTADNAARWRSAAHAAARAVREAFSEFHPGARGVLEAAPDVYKYAIYERDPIESWTVEQALVSDEQTRKLLTSRIQLESRGNTWLHFGGDTSWVYGHDAWAVELASADPRTGASAAPPP